MPLSYVRKRSANTSVGYLKIVAKQKVERGSSIREASRRTGVPYSTLRRFVLNESCSKTGRPALFSEYQQKTIFKALSFTYLTVKQLRKHVFLFSKNMRVQIPASWKMQKLAGYEWCLSFIKKFPNVGLFIKKSKLAKTSVPCIKCLRDVQLINFGFACEECCQITCYRCFRCREFRCCNPS